MQTYTLSGIQSMLGLSRAVVTGLVAAGFVTPSRGKRREYRFSFQDVVLLRTAYSLQAAKIPAGRIVRALQRLKASLPSELPLTGLRITAVGSDVAVREGNRQWAAESGQLLMDFEVKPAQGSVEVLSGTVPDDRLANARAAFELGLSLENDAPVEAEQAYRESIRIAPDFVDPYLNLGVLLIEAGRASDAVTLCRQAVKAGLDEPLLYFNLGVAYEDLGDTGQALDCYATCIHLAPDLADAHYNAARLHEQLGHAKQAIRLYSEYRRLQR
jgi:tetratricopeptide (TPR) repeat protein